MFKQKGQTGFCDGTDYDDVDYDEETPDDVSYFKYWGYCDDKCHVSVRDLGATVLQEVSGIFICSSFLQNNDVVFQVKLFALTEKDALIRTSAFKDEEMLHLRPLVY